MQSECNQNAIRMVSGRDLRLPAGWQRPALPSFEAELRPPWAVWPCLPRTLPAGARRLRASRSAASPPSPAEQWPLSAPQSWCRMRLYDAYVSWTASICASTSPRMEPSATAYSLVRAWYCMSRSWRPLATALSDSCTDLPVSCAGWCRASSREGRRLTMGLPQRRHTSICPLRSPSRCFLGRQSCPPPDRDSPPGTRCQCGAAKVPLPYFRFAPKGSLRRVDFKQRAYPEPVEKKENDERGISPQ